VALFTVGSLARLAAARVLAARHPQSITPAHCLGKRDSVAG
jgi:hypothetical protein